MYTELQEIVHAFCELNLYEFML